MNEDQLELVTDIVRAYVSNNSVRPADLPQLIADVSASLAALVAPPAEPAEERQPAVNPKKSVFPDHIISLENGKRFKSLKRHLSTLGMTPDEYRAKWSLPRDYPMVAADYASRRSELAKQIGLGRKPKAAEEGIAAPVEAAAPAEDKETAAKPRRARAKKAAEA